MSKFQSKHSIKFFNQCIIYIMSIHFFSHNITVGHDFSILPLENHQITQMPIPLHTMNNKESSNRPPNTQQNGFQQALMHAQSSNHIAQQRHAQEISNIEKMTQESIKIPIRNFQAVNQLGENIKSANELRSDIDSSFIPPASISMPDSNISTPKVDSQITQDDHNINNAIQTLFTKNFLDNRKKEYEKVLNIKKNNDNSRKINLDEEKDRFTDYSIAHNQRPFFNKKNTQFSPEICDSNAAKHHIISQKDLRFFWKNLIIKIHENPSLGENIQQSLKNYLEVCSRYEEGQYEIAHRNILQLILWNPGNLVFGPKTNRGGDSRDEFDIETFTHLRTYPQDSIQRQKVDIINTCTLIMEKLSPQTREEAPINEPQLYTEFFTNWQKLFNLGYETSFIWINNSTKPTEISYVVFSRQRRFL